MARRKKTSPIEDLFDIASSIHWKISLIIAVISYFFFHYFAIQALPVATDLHSVANSFGKQLFITFSKFIQYLIPVIFITVIAASLILSTKDNPL